MRKYLMIFYCCFKNFISLIRFAEINFFYSKLVKLLLFAKSKSYAKVLPGGALRDEIEIKK